MRCSWLESEHLRNTIENNGLMCRITECWRVHVTRSAHGRAYLFVMRSATECSSPGGVRKRRGSHEKQYCHTVTACISNARVTELFNRRCTSLAGLLPAKSLIGPNAKWSHVRFAVAEPTSDRIRDRWRGCGRCLFKTLR